MLAMIAGQALPVLGMIDLRGSRSFARWARKGDFHEKIQGGNASTDPVYREGHCARERAIQSTRPVFSVSTMLNSSPRKHRTTTT